MDVVAEHEADYRGNQPRSTSELSTWLAREPHVRAIEPGMPIVDPHHHLFGARDDRLFYQMEDLQRDLDSGHRLIGTVYVEAYKSGWRTAGPEAMRPVGEVEQIVALTRQPLPTDLGTCQVAAGIVCHTDLSIGEASEEVLQAHLAASDGRLRGVRQRSALVEGQVARFTPNARKPLLLADAAFRRGFARMAKLGLSFDTWIYHTQLGELIDLVDAFPEVSIIVNHMAGPIGVAQFRARRAEVFRDWSKGMHSLAERPNVAMKIGGMGMPLLGHGFDRWSCPAKETDLAEAWRPYIEGCIDAFGTSRCMFESNFPVDKQSCSYVSLWNAFKLVTQDWSDDERQDLFYRTACRVYRLPDIENLGDALSTSRPKRQSPAVKAVIQKCD